MPRVHGAILFVLSSLGAIGAPFPPISPCTQLSCSATDLGCFSDDNNARTLPGPNLTSVPMTYTVCQRYCSYQGYSYAGVEYGSQCFCGRDAPDHARVAPASDCAKMPCTGNASEACGAADRLIAFHVDHCQLNPISEPYCNSSLSTDARIQSLLGSMSTAQKESCLRSGGCSIGDLGIPMQQLWRESLHGLRYNCARDVIGRGSEQPVCPTSFPHAQLLAASFNRSAWSAVGTSIANEARGFYNLWMMGNSTDSSHALSYFAPDVNLCRDPRWGRCVEVPGEDPFLTGEYGRHYVGAMQEKDGAGYYKAMCNLKHYNSYDVERGSTSQGKGEPYSRSGFNAVVTPRDLVETYLAHFRTIALAADNAGVMCSYNAEDIVVNGERTGEVPSCANGLLLNQVLRAKFNFSGMVVSDAGAVSGIQYQHHYTNTTSATVQKALRGGTDLNLGEFFKLHLNEALVNGNITMSDVDLALTRVFRQYFDLGVGNTPGETPWTQYGLADIDSQEHRQLALDTATQGMVLLTNKDQTLPLGGHGAGSSDTGTRTTAATPRVAMVGPHINSTTELLANYFGENLLVLKHSPLQAFQARSDVDVAAFAQGCELAGNDTSGFNAALDAVDAADVVLMFLGLRTMDGPQNATMNNAAMEREGFDRTFLTLPEIQANFSRAIIQRAASHSPRKRVVAVLINSGGLDASLTYANADAVLESFYPGELGGDAIASVIMGDVSPSGRMPTTVYPASFTAARNITDMVLRPHPNSYDSAQTVPGVTHRFYPKNETIFPFGYGLSYTTFEVQQASPQGWSQGTTTSDLFARWEGYYANPPVDAGLPSYTVKVTNTGPVTSDVVVLGFVSKTSGNGQRTDVEEAQVQAVVGQEPLESLFGFAREGAVQPGESRLVTLAVPSQALATVDSSGVESLQPGEWAVRIGGDPMGFAEGSLTVAGAAVETFRLPLPTP